MLPGRGLTMTIHHEAILLPTLIGAMLSFICGWYVFQSGELFSRAEIYIQSYLSACASINDSTLATAMHLPT